MCIVHTVANDEPEEIIARSHQYVADVYIYKKTLNPINRDATNSQLERKMKHGYKADISNVSSLLVIQYL